jgi:phenylacetate-CoA ligase
MVRFHGIFIDIPSIIEGQIIQHTLQNFEIQLVLSKPLSEDDKSKMANRMISQLGNINLIFNTVDTIHRNQNGKIKAVISHVIR